MVVTEDDGGGIVIQAALDHFPWMHLGTIDGASEQFLEGDRPVSGIQEQAGEHLVGEPTQTVAEIITGALGIGQWFAALQGFAQVAGGQFQRGLQATGAGRSESGFGCQSARTEVQQAAQ